MLSWPYKNCCEWICPKKRLWIKLTLLSRAPHLRWALRRFPAPAAPRQPLPACQWERTLPVSIDIVWVTWFVVSSSISSARTCSYHHSPPGQWHCSPKVPWHRYLPMPLTVSCQYPLSVPYQWSFILRLLTNREWRGREVLWCSTACP